MQVAAHINQDQNISKDLTLWNQQGSQVLRGQMLVLPIGEHVPLRGPDLHSGHARRSMPQLKKVVLAVGNRLIYADTYDAGAGAALERRAATGAAGDVHGESPRHPRDRRRSAPPAAAASGTDARLQRVRDHLRRYREFAAQGKWSEAGKELEAIEAEVRQ